MIYVTGDCHSDFFKLTRAAFPEQKDMTKDDTVIICGDFGGVWYEDDYFDELKIENKRLDMLDDKPFTTVFVDGNHENFNRLEKLPVKEWNGGKVHVVRPSVLHLMRGEVFEIEVKKFFAFGGASSHDIRDGVIEMDTEGKWEETAKLWWYQNKMFRIKDLTWWEQELPTQEEMDNGLLNLAKHGNKVDFIISHCASSSVASVFSAGLYKPDILTDYLEKVCTITDFEHHFFGHYHDNCRIMGNHNMLYEQIVRIS